MRVEQPLVRVKRRDAVLRRSLEPLAARDAGSRERLHALCDAGRAVHRSTERAASELEVRRQDELRDLAPLPQLAARHEHLLRSVWEDATVVDPEMAIVALVGPSGVLITGRPQLVAVRRAEVAHRHDHATDDLAPLELSLVRDPRTHLLEEASELGVVLDLGLDVRRQDAPRVLRRHAAVDQVEVALADDLRQPIPLDALELGALHAASGDLPIDDSVRALEVRAVRQTEVVVAVRDVRREGCDGQSPVERRRQSGRPRRVGLDGEAHALLRVDGGALSDHLVREATVDALDHEVHRDELGRSGQDRLGHLFEALHPLLVGDLAEIGDRAAGVSERAHGDDAHGVVGCRGHVDDDLVGLLLRLEHATIRPFGDVCAGHRAFTF